MKASMSVGILLSALAGVLVGATTYGAGDHFPNADSAFGANTAKGSATDDTCGSYYDPFRLIGVTPEQRVHGYYDPYRHIGGPAEGHDVAAREEVTRQGRIACNVSTDDRAEQPM